MLSATQYRQRGLGAKHLNFIRRRGLRGWATAQVDFGERVSIGLVDEGSEATEAAEIVDFPYGEKQPQDLLKVLCCVHDSAGKLVPRRFTMYSAAESS